MLTSFDNSDLADTGVERPAVVMSKGWEQVVAALGILMTGAAYLPIEASLPKDRVSQLLELGQVAAVVAQPDALVNHFSISLKYPVILVQDVGCRRRNYALYRF